MTEPPKPVQDRTWDDLQSIFQQLEQHRNDKDRQLFELIKMIKEYDLPLENCRSMFESYCKKQNLTKSGWKSFFRHLEHRIECIQRALEEMDVFKVVEKVGGFVGSISIIGAALVYIFSDLPQRTIQTQYEAWEVVRENQGDRASGGRIEAIESLNNQNVSLAEINLENAILPEINLSGADLWGANLKRIRFRGADLSDANLSHANLSEAKLIDTIVNESEYRHNYNNYNIHGQINLKGADLTNADLSHADLRSDKTNLNQAKLIGSSLLYAKLSDADLSFAKLQRCELSHLGSIVSGNGKFFHSEPSDTCDSEESVYKKILNGADPNNDANIKRRLEQSLAGANLNHADLRKTNLSRANLSNANLLYANLEEANLKDVILKKAIYNNKTRFSKGFTPKSYEAILVDRGANLKHRDLMLVNLSGVDLSPDKQNKETKTNLTNAYLIRANLSYANLKQTIFKEARLNLANLEGAALTGVDLKGADLRGANLRKADLTGANLTKAKLNGADLREADLTAADLTGADFTDAKVTEDQSKVAKNHSKAIGISKEIYVSPKPVR